MWHKYKTEKSVIHIEDENVPASDNGRRMTKERIVKKDTVVDMI